MRRVRTRFAPSPTGFLHIGGLRTALFAFLFARHHGGEFLLRIEDTDRTRYVDGALDDILESLRWMQITWDEGPGVGGIHAPYLQSERLAIYQSHAFDLIQTKHAYKCFCSPERLAAVREEQKRLGTNPGYNRHCRYLTPEEVQLKEEDGVPFVIRLMAPEDGETLFEDQIRGTIRTQNSVLDDTVLLKSDGYPTYHLANVVDDHLMEITHVIRGEEWISSTPRHIILYKAFGWTPPAFAHVPVILAKGGGKLSKRHGATTVKEFKQKGYLSEALLNFIALLGWSLDDKTELFSLEDLISCFDLHRVNKAPAVFSYEKLDWFNGIYIRKKKVEELYKLLLPFLRRENLLTDEELPQYREYVLKIIPLIQQRMVTLGEVSERAWFFFDRHFKIKDKEALIPKKFRREDTEKVLELTKETLSSVSTFQKEELESAFGTLLEKLNMQPGPVFMIVRVSITGTTVSPGLFETMELLGRERVLKRLEAARETVKTTP
jgi:glutamyl-tRNA synthetase